MSNNLLETSVRHTPLPIFTRLTRWSLTALIAALTACASMPSPSTDAAPALIPVRHLVADWNGSGAPEFDTKRAKCLISLETV
jgi:hypothetical protein